MFDGHFFAASTKQLVVWRGVKEREFLGPREAVPAPAFDGDMCFPLLADPVGDDVSRAVCQDRAGVVHERACLFPCDAESVLRVTAKW